MRFIACVYVCFVGVFQHMPKTPEKQADFLVVVDTVVDNRPRVDVTTHRISF